jgi:hypothetical protein
MKAGVGIAAVAVAAASWLPCLHPVACKPLSDFYQENGISPKARQLATRHLRLWTEPSLRQAELRKMRTATGHAG